MGDPAAHAAREARERHAYLPWVDPAPEDHIEASLLAETADEPPPERLA